MVFTTNYSNNNKLAKILVFPNANSATFAIKSSDGEAINTAGRKDIASELIKTTAKETSHVTDKANPVSVKTTVKVLAW